MGTNEHYRISVTTRNVSWIEWPPPPPHNGPLGQQMVRSHYWIGWSELLNGSSSILNECFSSIPVINVDSFHHQVTVSNIDSLPYHSNNTIESSAEYGWSKPPWIHSPNEYALLLPEQVEWMGQISSSGKFHHYLPRRSTDNVSK